MSIDVAAVRAETPGVDNVLHFNNAGAALMPRPVRDAMLTHIAREAEIGGYEAEEAAAEQLAATYDALARLVNANPREIAVVENATVAWQMAFYGLARTFAPGDRVLTVNAEYASNFIAYLQMARRHGIEISVIGDDPSGQVDVAALEQAIDERVKLISMTHVPTTGGLVNPAREVGEIARRHAIPYLLDACQSVGQLTIDVEVIGCDMLSATGRKYLRGPRGIGFLYVKDTILERIDPPVLDLHGATWVEPARYDMLADARRFENWENNVAGKIGLGVAADYALGLGLADIEARVGKLAESFRRALARLPGIMVADTGRRKCGIVTFAHEKIDAAAIAKGLAADRINVSIATESGTLLDMRRRELPTLVRASVHYYNTDEEIERFLASLRAIIA